MSSPKARGVTSQTAKQASDTTAAPMPFAGEAVNPDPSPADQQRRRETQRAWAAYRGEFPEVFKSESGQPSDNIRANRCAAIVDKGVSWLAGRELTLSVTPSDEDGVENAAAAESATPTHTVESDGSITLVTPNGPTPAKPSPAAGQPSDPRVARWEAALRQVWGASDDMMTLFTMLAMNGAVSGHAYLKIVWDSTRMQYPRFAPLDSQNVYVVTDPDDCNRAVVYVIEYRASLGLTSAGQPRVITKRQVIALVDPDGNARLLGGEDADDTWTITNYWREEPDTATASGGSFGSLNANQSAWRQSGPAVVWPYPFPPIVDAMNLPNPNEYYGLPDLPPALIDLNERLQFVESNIAKIIKSHAHPWVFASGCDPSAIRNEPGVVQGLPSPESKVFAVSASGDLTASMAFAETLRADMDEQSRVPAIALGRQETLPRGQMSGVALELLFQPLIEKTQLKQRLYGQLIRKASAYALTLLGLIDAPRDVEIDIHWPDLLPNDDLALGQLLVQLQQVGFSQHTLIRRADGDPDEEAAWKAEEAQAQTLAAARGQGMPGLPMQMPMPGMSAPAQQQQPATPPRPLNPPTPPAAPARAGQSPATKRQ
ncbi:MAG TPA: phage portal protein [Ktedonobacterales bacterium]|nr:phage portal protein [Ktedonobacterales bacterium]